MEKKKEEKKRRRKKCKLYIKVNNTQSPTVSDTVYMLPAFIFVKDEK